MMKDLRWLLFAPMVVAGALTIPTASAQQPYGGSRWAIPGKIEAENYDQGGNNVGYYDNTAGNAAGNYRPGESVDIDWCASGGYAVGWIAAGEWLKYSVNVATTGTYTLRINLASVSSSASFVVRVDGQQVARVVTPVTGGYQTWSVVSVPGVSLTAGAHSLQIYQESANFNLDYYEFVLTSSPPATAGGPYQGVRRAIPGRIQAEDYDLGGNNVGYNDVDSANVGGQYRTDGVDVEQASTGGYDVGWIYPGEWLSYSVSVAQSATYRMTTLAAAPQAGSRFRVAVDGAVVASVDVPATSGYQSYSPVTVEVPLTAGNHVLKLLMDTAGFNLDSFEFATASSPTSGPFKGAPAAVPGRIQAEDYDLGGGAVGYNDVDPSNAGGQYRQDGVDIERASTGSYDVGWIYGNEWMNYTVNVAASGPYDVTLSIASPYSGKSLRLDIDGVAAATFAVPVTGGYQAYRPVKQRVSLPAGKHVLRLFSLTDGYNLDWMDIQPASASTPAPTATPPPVVASPSPSVAPTATPPVSTAGCIPSTTTGTGKRVYYTATGSEPPPAAGDQVLKTDGPYPYFLRLPPGYDPSQARTYPLIFFMHGIGERGGGGLSDLDYIQRNFGPSARAQAGREFPAFIVVPQLPTSETWDASWSNAWSKSKTLIDVIASRYKVNKARIYATGLSLGGGGTWGLTGSFAPSIAAAVPVCGSRSTGLEPSTFVPTMIANRVPVWAFHGSDDPTVPPGYTTDQWFNQYATSLGSDVSAMATYPGSAAGDSTAHFRTDLKRFEWTPGQTLKVPNAELYSNIHYSRIQSNRHDIWWSVYSREEVYEWMFCQSK